MAIVWPCTLSVDAYAAAERNVEVPRAECPSCRGPMVFWSGYLRFVRHEGRAHRIWVPRGRCRPCSATHALLPAFVVLHRLDSIETIGDVLESSTSGGGVRPAAERLGVPHTTARGWVRSFGRRARSLAVALRRPRRRARRGGTDDGDGSDAPRPGGHRRRLEGGHGPAGVAGGDGLALLLVGVRRDGWWPPTRTPPISSSADVVSCLQSLEDHDRRGEERSWTTTDQRRWPCTAGR